MQNRFKRIFSFFGVFLLFFIFVTKVSAATINISCANRYLTLINPVRNQSLWADSSLSPLEQQYSEVEKYSFPATWLLQYDTFSDRDLIDEIKSFDSKQEKGVFLEVSKELAADAGVTYPIYLRWSDPGAVFLSAYSQSDRRKLIDQAFEKYKKTFGTFPRSVGAWWIDSYSLNYMVNKYQVRAALIVADQKVTDSYGVWGQWWGFPYKPSKANILVPASDNNNFENAVILQWAQRDPVLAYGGVGQFSRYSLQANDYVAVGKDISYFKSLTSQYLDCTNPLGQITVGLETGMESVSNPLEYEKQLQYLSTIPGLNVVTMLDFAEKYSEVYKINPDKVFFGNDSYEWIMTPGYRENQGLGEKINYNQNISFKDYFLKDNSGFLNRVLPISGINKTLFPWYLLVSFLLFLVSLRLNLFRVWFSSTFFLLVGYGLIIRSTYKFGWQVFYGPQVQRLEFFQIFIVLVSFATTFVIGRIFKNKFNLLLFPLVFGLDQIISALRYTAIEGARYFGITLGNARFIGIKIANGLPVIANQIFGPIQFQSLTKFDFSKIWQKQFLYFVANPAIHLVIAVVLWRILIKLPEKIKYFVFIVLFILFVLELKMIFTSDPISVTPIN